MVDQIKGAEEGSSDLEVPSMARIVVPKKELA